MRKKRASWDIRSYGLATAGTTTTGARRRARRLLDRLGFDEAVQRGVDEPARAHARIAPIDPTVCALDVLQRHQAVRARPADLRDLVGVGVFGPEPPRR